jgi:hypothetical protein
LSEPVHEPLHLTSPVHDPAQHQDETHNQNKADRPKGRDAGEGRLEPLKRTHPHPQAEHQGSDEKAEAELQAKSIEAQHEAEDDENFNQGWNGLNLLLNQ